VSWGPELRAELAELFREAWEAGGRRRKLNWSALGMREGRLQGDIFGLTRAELTLLETLTVEPQWSRAVKRHALATETGARIRDRLVGFGLIRAWRAPKPRGAGSDGCFAVPGASRQWRGVQLVWYAEITQRGWRVLLGKEKARR
jgi:hypothetical protein